MTEIAKVYGEALYELARDENLSRQILDEIGVLNESFHQEPGFLPLLNSPCVPKEERCQIIDSSFRGMLHPYVVNFLKILTERGYIRHFDNCCTAYRQRYNTDNGILPVVAITAGPLSDDLRQRLTARLAQITGKTISLECRVDPSVLGGVRLDFVGKQVDGTVRRRLEDIRGILKNTVL